MQTSTKNEILVHQIQKLVQLQMEHEHKHGMQQKIHTELVQ